ncbi:MAG: cysteine dioxygenase [Rhodospirillaceae bacterium]|nr:cysteine dioxygenase [Rhodospirillaceae bacterium]
MAAMTRLRDFVRALTVEVGRDPNDEPRLLEVTSNLLGDLVSHDDWLPREFAEPHPDHYQQYLLHCDPLERFSVVSFVWGPGQVTPIHNHTVWGVIGVLRGIETCEEFRLEDGGLASAGRHTVKAGQVDRVSPTIGDIHRVANARHDGPSVSIHVYGANIGAVQRSRFDPNGDSTPFVSGYSNDFVPNMWDRSDE